MKTFLSLFTALSLTWMVGAAPPEPLPTKPDEPATKPVEPEKKPAEPEKKPAEAEPLPAPAPATPAKIIIPELVLVPGEASAVPHRQGVAYANGGIIDVTQPNPTTLVITMSGLAAVNADLCKVSMAGYEFDLNQCFEVQYDTKLIKNARLSLEGKVVGLLRTDWTPYKGHWLKHTGGTAETSPAVATIGVGATEVVSMTIPARAAGCGEDLSVYNHEGPVAVPVTPGKYALHESWGFHTTHAAFCTRGASAEFSPQPSYVPDANAYWFHDFLPFNGAATKDFGFQVTVKLILE